MAEEVYLSRFGWQWIAPPGFTPLPQPVTNHMYSPSLSMCFKHESPDVHLSWAVLNGPPVDYITDARFKSLVSDKDPVNLPRLADILLGILPPAGEITEAHALKLADHSPAVEMTQVRVQRSGEPIHLYVLLFPLEPAAADRGPDFDYHAMRQFSDPITKQVIILSPVSLGERLNPETKEVQRIFHVGHDRYQRVIFSAPQTIFQSLIASVKRSARAFHYKTRVRAERHNWQDAVQMLHEEMNTSFEVLKNPPPGLRDEDIKRAVQ